MKKSSFWTFCFAFIPGAGQMYLGYIKRGVSLMLAFSLVIAVSASLYLPFLTVLLPVLWFYSFFDTFNIRSMSYNQSTLLEDKFLFNLDDMVKKDFSVILKKRHTLIGVICIVAGAYMLYNNCLARFLWKLEETFPWLVYLLRNLPSTLVAFAVIYLGIRLVRGGGKKAAALPQEEDFVEYGGNSNE